MNTRTLQLHVTALQALVMCVLVHMAKTDREGLREILEDPAIVDPVTMPDLAHFPLKDRIEMKKTLDAITRPLRTAISDPAGNA